MPDRIGAKRRTEAAMTAAWVKQLHGMDLRGVVVVAAAAAIEATSFLDPEVLSDTEAVSCENAIDMALSFAAGEAATAEQTLPVVSAASALAEKTASNNTDHSVAVQVIYSTALAANAAYLASQPPVIEEAGVREVLSNAQSAFQSALRLNGVETKTALKSTFAIVAQIRPGKLTNLGSPLDLSWDEPQVRPAKGFVDPRKADWGNGPAPIFCFFINKVGDDLSVKAPLLKDVVESAEAANKYEDKKYERPRFVLYLQRVDVPTYLRLTALGILVVTKADLGGVVPLNEEGFARAYKSTLKRWMNRTEPSVLSSWKLVANDARMRRSVRKGDKSIDRSAHATLEWRRSAHKAILQRLARKATIAPG